MLMRRIHVVGTSGSGKSTIARQLSGTLGAPCLELDGIFHQHGWRPLPGPEFRRVVSEWTRNDRWVIDGNYSAVQDIIWERADTVVWFDLPRRTVMRQLAWRTARRVITREELWNGNRERWRHLFTLDPGRSVMAWAWHSHSGYRSRYSGASSDPGNGHIRFIRLGSRADARRLVAAARSQAARDAAG
jgi:adenylate kinase family enzyme